MPHAKKTYYYFGKTIWKYYGKPPGEPNAKNQTYYVVSGQAHPNYYDTLTQAKAFCKRAAKKR